METKKKKENNEEITDVAIIEANYIEKVDRIDTETIIHNIKAQSEIFNALQEYVKSHMKESIDFGVIPGCQKPSLWKPGAEKINFMFNLVPKYEILKETETNSEYTYKIRCDLYNKNNQKFMGSGLGYASSREKKFANAPANTILKMAKKRAYIDATLSATMASFIFTQDVIEEEDAKKDIQIQDKDKIEVKKDEFDWSKVDLNKKPYWAYNPKTKSHIVPPIVKRLFAIARKIFPDDVNLSEEFKKITGKEHSWEYTFGDLKTLFEYLDELKEMENEEGLTEEKMVEIEKNI